MGRPSFIVKFYIDLHLQLGTYSHGSKATFYSAAITQRDLQWHFQDLQRCFSNATIALIFFRLLRSPLISTQTHRLIYSHIYTIMLTCIPSHISPCISSHCHASHHIIHFVIHFISQMMYKHVTIVCTLTLKHHHNTTHYY